MATSVDADGRLEIESIEKDDSLHDFAGPHSNKGNDFAHYWLLLRALELEKTKADYVLVCEFVQDIAEFNSLTPTAVKLYQLKKKEGAYWTASDLTGQTKSDEQKTPKPDRPVYKLLSHIRKFKKLTASGAFVSNAKFDVLLKTGKSSINETKVRLNDWNDAHTKSLKMAIASAEGIDATEVDLDSVDLLHTSLAIDDMQRHMNGVMLEFLGKVVPEHIAQAPSLVDTLFCRVKARARRTEKCSDWPELAEKRGFSNQSFASAIESLSAIPDKARARAALLDSVVNMANWQARQHALVTAALAQCSLEKILLGDASRWGVPRAELWEVCETSQNNGSSDFQIYEALCSHIAVRLPVLSTYEMQALAIYEMTEWTFSPIPV